MKTRSIILLLTIILFPISIIASWSVFPWTLKTNENIKVESIPYRIYEGYDLGITKVYQRNRLLYSIEEYFSNFIILSNTGEYFVSINLGIWQKGIHVIEIDENGSPIPMPRIEEFKGEAIKIYKNGKIVRTIDFIDLPIDTSLIEKRNDKIYWLTNNEYLRNCPAYIKNDTLNIFTIDNQIIPIALSTGEQLNPKVLKAEKVDYLASLLPKRKFKVKQKGFPEKFLLPKLENGKTIEEGLAEYLKLKPAENERDIALVKIYFHTLLITKEGQCEKCHVSPTKRENIETKFGYDYDLILKKKIEDWIYQQKYDTRLIPRYTDKYVFSDFIYLKEE